MMSMIKGSQRAVPWPRVVYPRVFTLEPRVRKTKKVGGAGGLAKVFPLKGRGENRRGKERLDKRQIRSFMIENGRAECLNTGVHSQ